MASGQSSVESSPSISLAVSTRSPISPSNSSSSVIVSSAPSVSYILPSPKKNNQQLFIAPKQGTFKFSEGLIQKMSKDG